MKRLMRCYFGSSTTEMEKERTYALEMVKEEKAEIKEET